MERNTIKIKGACQNNLKNISVAIPVNTITAITGVSGSGKSSLAFDTLYAEGQRRYIETFSTYARQFMERMDKPVVDSIEDIPTAIAIGNTSRVSTSRSTVGTMTGITDYVKLLYERLGELHCRKCGRPVVSETTGDVWKALKGFSQGSEIVVTIPWLFPHEGSERLKKELLRIGFNRVFQNGQIKAIEEAKQENGQLHILVDRLKLQCSDKGRVFDSLEQAFHFGRGRLDVWIRPGKHVSFSSNLECRVCNITYKKPVPGLFSFNSPAGACERCNGFGKVIDIDLGRIIPDESLSLREGAIKPWGNVKNKRMEFEDLLDFCQKYHIPLDIPFKDLAEYEKQLIIEGNDEFYGIGGFFKWLESKKYKMHVRVFLSRYREYAICPECHGTRFKRESLLYYIGGLNIGEVYALSIKGASDFFNHLSIPPSDKAGAQVLNEIKDRLAYLIEVGIGYLTLDRQSRTLSKGELQRVALTSALGSSLVNTLYILDEPSIGLHPRDNNRLIGIIKRLKNLQNTVIIVEHDPEIISESDFMLDLGPGAGEKGGEIMYFGPMASVDGSITSQYLIGQRQIPMNLGRRTPSNGKWLIIQGAAQHNLKNIDITVPLDLFVCLTGVSGSGKSTLAEDIIYKGIRDVKSDRGGQHGAYGSIKGVEYISAVEMVDQSPIGRTPRGNPITYIHAMGAIRDLLASTDMAVEKGFTPSHFSFNVAGGRCENCKGQGSEKVEMQFLSDVFITCPECKGRRFKGEVLDVKYRDTNIYEMLSMTVEEASNFFYDQPKIVSLLKPLIDVGLDYVKLGQPINTLSGGEAQRLKLSRYLKSSGTGHRLFVLDEPTTGLHFKDIERLISLIQTIVNQGNTVLVIEHNMDVVKNADWIIDLGPEGGEAGGEVVVAGPPEKVASYGNSYTGVFLKRCMENELPVKTGSEVDKTGFNDSNNTAKNISIKGAREHNLKNLSLSIPRQKLVVLTGVSGSGKSTLAFDVIFAEGQRRYLESLTPYARQYIKVLERPKIDFASGLPPTVAIQQRVRHGGKRSTVATLTEVYHFLRLLYSKLGVQYCPICGLEMSSQSEGEIIEKVRKKYTGKGGVIAAPIIRGRKGVFKDLFARLMKQGFEYVRIDGEIRQLAEDISPRRYREHTIDLVLGNTSNHGLNELVINALRKGRGACVIIDDNGQQEVFSLNKRCPKCGIGTKELDPTLFSFNSKHGACPECQGLGYVEDGEGEGFSLCPQCKGSRLKPEAISVKINGYSIWDLVQNSAEELLQILKNFNFDGEESFISKPILDEVFVRLNFMRLLGISYLALSRDADTLSGGEMQRIRLSAQLGSNLTGICYILDEPTIGLHSRDNRMLLDALKILKDRGNSIIVVEHDEETIREADFIIDLGPGAGERGGELVASGGLKDLTDNRKSATGLSLSIPSRQITSRLRPYKLLPKIEVLGASEHNLKGINVSFPLGTLTCVTGVSGSGKSTLLQDILYKGLSERLLNKHAENSNYRDIRGWEAVGRVLEVDHSPIGLTPRSVPISYIGVLSGIRELFSMTPEARMRGYGPGRFSFNVAGGRCEACKGHGLIKVEMSFLPDVYIACEQCGGRRFNSETLSVEYKGKSIAGVLDLTFDEAEIFFSSVPRIKKAFRVVREIGLGYLKLGQASPTLSGGEAQRIKIAKELVRPANGHTLYILDEPSTGLHFTDIATLIDVFQKLVDKGNTIVLIEHNLDIIKSVDYIIDLGPEGGNNGGELIAAGSPVEILDFEKSYTAHYLKRYISHNA